MCIRDSVYGALADGEEAADLQVTGMNKIGEQGSVVTYEGKLQPADSGQLSIGVRVRPDHPDLINPNEMGLSTWA